MTIRRVVVAATVSMATLMAAVLLWNFRGAAALFVISLAVAAALRPLVETLEPRLGRALALVVIYVSVLALLGVFAYVVTHDFLREVDAGLERLRGAYDRLRSAGGADAAGERSGFARGSTTSCGGACRRRRRSRRPSAGPARRCCWPACSASPPTPWTSSGGS